MHSSANSDHSPCSSIRKLFHIEFPDLHVSKEDSINPGVIKSNANSSKRNTSLMKILFLCQFYVAAIIHASQKETHRVRELRQLGW